MNNPNIFVLWGNKFMESMTVIFVTELRRRGLMVKVVGLTQKRSNGEHGLALLPDITLDEALSLSHDVTCIVIPCSSSAGKHLRNEPRLDDFFRQAHANKAKFIIGPLDDYDLALFPADMDKVVVGPDSENIVGLARTIAQSLSTVAL